MKIARPFVRLGTIRRISGCGRYGESACYWVETAQHLLIAMQPALQNRPCGDANSVIQKRNKNRAAVRSLRHDSSNKRMRPIRRIPVNVTSPAELVRRRSTRDLGSSRCSVRESSRQVGRLAAVGGYSYRFYKKWA